MIHLPDSITECSSLYRKEDEKMNPMQEKKYAFFRHSECEFFPCHKTDDVENFNCLFCYCPLYALGEACGGNFRYNDGLKDCSECMLPHVRENYENITGRFRDVAELAKPKEE